MPWMSEADICEMYKSAKDQRAQINILAQLNACRSETIRKILLKNGITPVEPRTVKHRDVPQKIWSVEELTELMHMIDSGTSNEELAIHFGRTVLAVKCVKTKLNPAQVANPSGNIKRAIEIYRMQKGALLN